MKYGNVSKYFLTTLGACLVGFISMNAMAVDGNFDLLTAESLGVGTLTPNPETDVQFEFAVDPAIRLQQAGGASGTDYRWDMIGSHEGFSIRDRERDNIRPFSIMPGNGNVAIAPSDPPGNTFIAQSPLHVMRDDGTANLLVEEKSTPPSPVARKLFTIKNDGGNAKFNMFAENIEWAFNAAPESFRISLQNSGIIEMRLFDNGNLEIAGSLTQASSRDLKHDIINVDPLEILNKVTDLSISRWAYNHDNNGAIHMGPMAEDFYEIFGLGHTAKGISSIDTGGVALAAIQGLKIHLQEVVDSKDNEIKSLKEEINSYKSKNDNLSDRLARLEALVTQLATKDKIAMNF